MKLRILVVAILASCCMAPIGRGDEKPPAKNNIKTFMRAKLHHAQQVLEGLTLEDYDLIADNADKMSLLSNAAQWQVIQTPEYVRRSGEFRRATDALAAAAKAKNLDGATLAYVRITMRCVDCHKYVRSVRQARIGKPSLEAAGLVKSSPQAH